MPKCRILVVLLALRVPVTQWVKHWPSDLAVSGLIPSEGGFITHSLSLWPSHYPDMTEIL